MHWFDPQTWPRGPTYALAAIVACFELAVLARALSPDTHPVYHAYFIARTTTCLDKEIPETYRLGETISFLPDGAKAAAAIRVCGWTNPVGNGTHSKGESSRLRVALEEQHSDLDLTLHLVASKPQTVRVTANGTDIGKISVPGGDRQLAARFRVPKELARRGKSLEIELYYPDGILPNLRASNVHKRAIHLLSFRLEPA